MCFTVEPSVFIPGRFGARTEDVVVVSGTRILLQLKNGINTKHSAVGDHIVVRLATTPALQADVRRAVAGNLCRCGAYPNIVKAGVSAGKRKS